jgi:hypothetical protein
MFIVCGIYFNISKPCYLPTEYAYGMCMTFIIMNNYVLEQHSMVGLHVFCEVKGKVKVTLNPGMKVQRWSRGMVLLLL